MATEEEKTFIENASNAPEGTTGSEQPARRPRFTRPADEERQPRPRFTREGGAPRYQKVERPHRPYQPRYNAQGDEQQGSGDYAPRYSRERYYGSDNRGEGRPQRYYGNDNRGDSQRPYQGEPRPYRERRPYGEGQPRPYDRPQRPYQPRYNNREEYASRPQRPYQPRYEQGNSWEGQPEEGARMPRRPYAGDGYRPQGNPKGPKKFKYSEKYNKKKQIQYREEFVDPNEPIRLNKYLANAGVCSRREADEFMTAGVVTVNGQVVTELGTKVKRGDEVRFHDQLVSIERKIYILLNKPKDCVTTVDDPQERKTVMDYVKGACKERIYPVGRLDRNTTGVLLLTNDGEMASKLTHPSFMKKKVYHARLDKAIPAEDLEKLLNGIELEDGVIRCDAVSYTQTDTDHTQVGLEIHSGRNRIVRRMFEALGYHVVRLDRTQFAGLTKKNLRRGDWRFLTEKEVGMLRMGAYE
ncbi:MAG: RNA-binding S4 domain-containing protein [Bacteroidaceae bacterium]|nr:RNA-binding S4 domain-containing protein [Bacteroidaceae bacterium]